MGVVELCFRSLPLLAGLRNLLFQLLLLDDLFMTLGYPPDQVTHTAPVLALSLRSLAVYIDDTLR